MAVQGAKGAGEVSDGSGILQTDTGLGEDGPELWAESADPECDIDGDGVGCKGTGVWPGKTPPVPCWCTGINPKSVGIEGL